MKKHIVIKAHKFNKKANINIDYKTLLFFTFLVAGVIIGVFISENGSEEWHTFFTSLLKKYLSFNVNGNIFIMFMRVFLPFLILMIITYITGLCGVGAPFLLFTPLLLGCCFGVTVAQYYINFGLSGIACCGLIFLPAYAIATATLIKCCCRCVDISGEIFLYFATGKGENKPILKEYTIYFLTMLIPIVIGGVITTAFYKLFAHLFTFIV